MYGSIKIRLSSLCRRYPSDESQRAGIEALWLTKRLHMREAPPLFSDFKARQLTKAGRVELVLV